VRLRYHGYFEEGLSKVQDAKRLLTDDINPHQRAPISTSQSRTKKISESKEQDSKTRGPTGPCKHYPHPKQIRSTGNEGAVPASY
jgi:hypothetical protein